MGSVQVRKPGKDEWETANLDMVIEEESEIRTGKTARRRSASTMARPARLLRTPCSLSAASAWTP